MKKNKSIRVLYIAGNGHSGSTLLDIIIGSSPEIFSAGELGYITRDTIFDEKCSCGEKIAQCDLWVPVIKKWQTKTSISLSDYKKLRWKFERNMASFRVLKNSFLPSKSFIQYCEATLALFEAIQEETGKDIIVDSTKLPQRIPVLKKIVDLKVVHICRDAKGVLNSAKKSAKKDINAGIETDIPTRRTTKTLAEWTFVNMSTYLFTRGVPTYKVKYKRYLKDLKTLEAIDDSILINKSHFSTPHMLAGNILRLKKDIEINPNIGFKYSKLNDRQKKTAHLLDSIFPFWS